MYRDQPGNRKRNFPPGKRSWSQQRPQDDSNDALSGWHGDGPRHHGRQEGHSSYPGPRSSGIVVQEPYLNLLRRGRVPVTLRTLEGQEVRGLIDSFDRAAILLQTRSEGTTQLLLFYKHALLSVVPDKPVVRRGTTLGLGDGSSSRPGASAPAAEEAEADYDDWSED